MNLNIIIGVIILLLLYYTYNYKENFSSSSSTVLNEKQLLFKRTLTDIGDILNRHNIKYFLFCGTALGAHREKKFIEHDHDIDIAIFDGEETFKKIINIMKKCPNFSYSHQFPKKSSIDNITEVTFNHNVTNINVDIFMVYKINNTYTHYTYTSLCDLKPKRRCVFENKPFKIIDINFLGRQYKIPDKSFLTSNYGDDWHIKKNLSYDDIIRTHSI